MSKTVIGERVWSSALFKKLSSDAKLVYLYLVLNDRNNLIGIYEIHEHDIKHFTGLSTEELKNALRHIESSDEELRIVREGDYYIITSQMKLDGMNANRKVGAVKNFINLPVTLTKSILGTKFQKIVNGSKDRDSLIGFYDDIVASIYNFKKKGVRKKAPVETFTPEIQAFTNKVIALYPNEKMTEAKTKKWNKVTQTLLKKSYTEKDILAVVSYLHTDSFWSNQKIPYTLLPVYDKKHEVIHMERHFDEMKKKKQKQSESTKLDANFKGKKKSNWN